MLLMIYSCSDWRVLENTGALEQRHVDATERVGGGWVGGVAGGRRAGRARGWRSRSGSVGARWVRRGGGRCSRYTFGVLQHVAREHVPLRELDGRARVRRVLLRAGELREVLARDVHLDGPRDCQWARVLLDHVHAHGLERRVLRGGGLLGWRHESWRLRFARRAVGAYLIRAHRRCERLESTPGAGVDMWRVPRYPC